MKKNTVFFISDAHFGLPVKGEDNREDNLYKLFEQIKDKMSTLYILGDFFDFWIEYRSVVRFEYFRILCALRNIVDSGVDVHYLAGNHDFALGPFFKEQLGITAHMGSLKVLLQGKQVYMYHGDGLIKNDYGYRFLKKVLRNNLNQKIFKMLHPDFGIWLGTWSSGTSRKHNKYRINSERLKEYRQCARLELMKGNDIVFFGHSHKPELTRFSEGVYCNTGSWLHNYSYAAMYDGQVHLYKFQPGFSSEEFPLNEIK